MKQFIAIVSFALCIVISSGLTSAITLEYYGIEGTINDDFSITKVITFRFNEPINHMDYQLDFKISNLTAEANFDSVDCETINNDGKSMIACDFIGMTPEKNKLILTFNTKEGIKRTEDNFQFSANYGVSVPIERMFTLIKLPQKAILSAEIANESFFPKDGGVITDGKHIMVYWEDHNITEGGNQQYSVLYALQTDISNYMIVSVTIIIIIVMVGAAVYARRRGGEKQPAATEVITSVLNEDEKTIVNLLKANDGKALQKVLVRDSNFSKAKVSRLVKELSGRGLLKIDPVSGRENRIILNLEGKMEEEKE
jgi:uncharacterized membrane protein